MYLNLYSLPVFKVSSFETPLISDLGPLLCLIFFLVPVILPSFLFCFSLIFLVTTVAVSSAGPSSLLLLEHFALPVKSFFSSPSWFLQLLSSVWRSWGLLSFQFCTAPALSAAASKALPSAPRALPGAAP